MSGPGALLTTAEAAEYLGVAAQTLADWRYQRRGPRFVKVGTRVRYTMADLHEWVARCSQGGDRR